MLISCDFVAFVVFGYFVVNMGYIEKPALGKSRLYIIVFYTIIN